VPVPGEPADPQNEPHANVDSPPASRLPSDAGPESVRLAISNGLVRIKKELYGKGPTRAKTFINDNYVFTVLEGGLTRNEETLLAAGEHRLVREFRLRFQEAVADQIRDVVEEATRRRVVGYHSQIVFEPERAFEIFVLDEPPHGG
jgi:uncharacterized protein YbcI